jgi:hypothetical protein
MGKAKAVAAVVIVLVVAGIGASLLLGGITSGIQGSMDVTFYDSEGNEVTDPVLSPAFYDTGGQEIASFAVDLGYTVTIEGTLEDGSLDVGYTFKITIKHENWRSEEEVWSTSFSSSETSDSFTTSKLTIEGLLAGQTLADGDNWNINLVASAKATGRDDNSGNTVESGTWTDTDSITVTYKDAQLQVTGYVNLV